jgi:hypothetical protein
MAINGNERKKDTYQHECLSVAITFVVEAITME